MRVTFFILSVLFSCFSKAKTCEEVTNQIINIHDKNYKDKSLMDFVFSVSKKEGAFRELGLHYIEDVERRSRSSEGEYKFVAKKRGNTNYFDITYEDLASKKSTSNAPKNFLWTYVFSVNSEGECFFNEVQVSGDTNGKLSFKKADCLVLSGETKGRKKHIGEYTIGEYTLDKKTGFIERKIQEDSRDVRRERKFKERLRDAHIDSETLCSFIAKEGSKQSDPPLGSGGNVK